MKTIAHAYRDGGGTLSSGQVFDTMSYDGKGRRVKKAVTNTGDSDLTSNYYLDGDSTIESRDGSDYAYRQYVWGTRYIDELVESSQVTPFFTFPGNVFGPKRVTSTISFGIPID